MTGANAVDSPEMPCPEIPSFSSTQSRLLPCGDDKAGQAGEGPALSGIETMSPSSNKNHRPVAAAIIDKSELFRVGLKYILSGRRFRVTAECSRLSDLTEQAFVDGSCVALLGLDKDAQTVLPEITALKQKYRGLRIIALSAQFHADQLLAVIEAGADGYLLKNETSPTTLLKSVELVLVEGVVVPQGFAKLLGSRAQVLLDSPPAVLKLELPSVYQPPEPASDVAQTDDLARLSTKEHLVLMHLTRGDSNKSIARVLNIAEATVKVHVKSLLRKIRVCNRTQAAMWAMTHVQSIDGQNLRLSCPAVDIAAQHKRHEISTGFLTPRALTGSNS
jgi:two-component system, NarL family, nitrate/nitrite response regulator NarL